MPKLTKTYTNRRVPTYKNLQTKINDNGVYDRNVKALREVVPMNIPAHLIDFTLGSSWLDAKLYDEYVKERTDIDVHFTAAGGTWFMKAPSYGLNVEKNRAMGVTSDMVGKTIMGHELIEAVIQQEVAGSVHEDTGGAGEEPWSQCSVCHGHAYQQYSC